MYLQMFPMPRAVSKFSIFQVFRMCSRQACDFSREPKPTQNTSGRFVFTVHGRVLLFSIIVFYTFSTCAFMLSIGIVGDTQHFVHVSILA